MNSSGRNYPLRSFQRFNQNQGLLRFLEESGVRMVRNAATGGAVFCAETEDDQVIYVIEKLFDNTDIASDVILQPVHSLEFESSNIYFYPKVETKANSPYFSIDPEEVNLLLVRLLEDGYLMWDLKPENFGRLQCGTLVIIDRNSVVRASTCLTPEYVGVPKLGYFIHNYGNVGTLLPEQRNEFKRNITTWMQSADIEGALKGVRRLLGNRSSVIDYANAREKHLEKCGFGDRTVKGLIPDTELDSYGLSVGVLTPTYGLLVRDRGLYRSQWSRLVNEAVKEMDTEEGGAELWQKGFCGMIKKAAQRTAFSKN